MTKPSSCVSPSGGREVAIEGVVGGEGVMSFRNGTAFLVSSIAGVSGGA